MDAVESVVIMEKWTQKKMHPMMILKTMITCSKNSFDHKCHYAFWFFLQITERDLRIL